MAAFGGANRVSAISVMLKGQRNVKKVLFWRMTACAYQTWCKTYVWNTKGGRVEWNAVVTRIVTAGHKKK